MNSTNARKMIYEEMLLMRRYKNNIVPIPLDTNDFFNIDGNFNLVHLYITERVRSFQQQNKPCFISNDQFANELKFSVSTIRRAIKLLIDKKVLYTSYNTNNKKRCLYIYNKDIMMYP